MSTITFKGNKVNTCGELPKVGTLAPNFELVKSDLSTVNLADLKGKKVLLNIFPSLDTGVCAASVRKFNVEVGKLQNVVALSVSKDLPFAMGRFCGAEGINNMVSASGFRSSKFCSDYGILMTDGPLSGLYARAVVVIDETGKVVYTELVPEITQEPNYDKALAALS